MKATAPWRGRRDALRVLGGLALAPLAQSHAQAQATSWPTRPIKVLIGVPAGGTQDVLTRAIADAVKTSLGPIIIDNRGGAAGRIAVEAVKNADPDGHTLLLGTAGMMTMFPNAYKKLGYDPVKDFVPIVNAASFELAMTVHSAVPATTVAEFVSWAKTQGRDGSDVSFASYGAGTPSHFLGEMLNRAAGLKMVHVPYKGSTPARQDVMGGTVPLYFDTVGGALTMCRPDASRCWRRAAPDARRRCRRCRLSSSSATRTSSRRRGSRTTRRRERRRRSSSGCARSS